jgi:hypothetical protein
MDSGEKILKMIFIKNMYGLSDTLNGIDSKDIDDMDKH